MVKMTKFMEPRKFYMPVFTMNKFTLLSLLPVPLSLVAFKL